MGALAERDGIGRVDARRAAAAVQTGLLFEYRARVGHDFAVGCEAGLLRGLAVAHAAGVDGGADDELVAAAVLCQREVQAGAALARERLVQKRCGWRCGRVARRRGAFADVDEINVVAVQVAGLRARARRAHIGHAARHALGIEPLLRGERDERARAARRVGEGVEHAAPRRDQFVGNEAIAARAAVGTREAQAPVGRAQAAPELHVQVAEVARRLLAPAALAVGRCRDERMPALTQGAALVQLDPCATEAARAELDFSARVRQPRLSGEHQGAAERVQAVERVRARHQGHTGQRGLGHQVPIHHVAEGFVDANAVEEHRQALRRAQRRREPKAAIQHIDAVRVALHFIDRQAAEVLVQKLRQAARAGLVDLRVVCGLHIARQLAARHVQAGQGHAADHFDGGQLRRRLGRDRSAGREQREPRADRVQ